MCDEVDTALQEIESSGCDGNHLTPDTEEITIPVSRYGTSALRSYMIV